MKRTFITRLPNKAGAFLKATRIVAQSGANITRVSYNKAVDLHVLFLEVSGGKLLLSSLGLLQKKDRPEVRALLHGMCSFLQSPDAVPAARIDPAELAKLVQ